MNPDLSKARDHMFGLAAANPPDPEALAQATAEVRATFARAQVIFHDIIMEAAHQANQPAI